MKLVIAGLADKEISAEVSQIQTELKNPDNFLFTGWLSGKEKHEVFAQSKYHVLISDDENFAVAIAESLSYGKPVLVSSKVALSEFVARYNCGVVVEDLTIESVLKGFRILCELDYELLSHNALQASKSLTWDSVWINWDRALKQIIQ